ncbi:MAG TPA: hypothetical protein VGG60_06320 [Candidatus Binataceae bacterium]|jgi:hypothetical protein
MTDAPVALSDFALALEAAIFAGLINPLRRVGGERTVPDNSRNHTLIRWFELFFYAVAAASLIGGAVHGFVPDPTTAAARSLWPATMIAVGAAAWAAWGIGSAILLARDKARVVSFAATLEFLIYAAAVILGMRSYTAAILNYLPAVLFLLAIFIVGYARQRDRAHLLGATAMVVTLTAAICQQAKLAIDAVGLSHNALYHVVQGAGLWLLFMSASRLARVPPERSINR